MSEPTEEVKKLAKCLISTFSPKFPSPSFMTPIDGDDLADKIQICFDKNNERIQNGQTKNP